MYWNWQDVITYATWRFVTDPRSHRFPSPNFAASHNLLLCSPSVQQWTVTIRGCSPRPVLTHFGVTQPAIPDGDSSLVGVQLGGYWWVPHVTYVGSVTSRWLHSSSLFASPACSLPPFPPRSRQLDRSIWQRRGVDDRVIESQRRPSLWVVSSNSTL